MSRLRRFSLSLRSHVLLATLAGIGLRLLLPTVVEYDYPPVGGDAAFYDQLARNLAAHGVYSSDTAPPFAPTALRPPLLPFVASLSYRLFGSAGLPMHILHALLGLVTAFVVTLAVHRIAPPAAKLTAWFTMISPFDAIYAGRLLSEPLATFLLCVGMAMPILFETPWAWAIAGVLLGAGALARDTVLPLIPVVVCAALVFRVLRGRVRRWVPVLLIAGAAVVLLPWMYRNCTAIGTCSVTSKGLVSMILWVGTWERDGNWSTPAGPAWPDDAFDNDEERAQLSKLNIHDPANDPLFRRAALAHIKNHPLRVLSRWLIRAPRMWIGTRTDLFEFRAPFTRHSRAWSALKFSCYALNLIWLLMGAAGIVLAFLHWRRLLWFAVPIVATLFVYLPFHDIETRYSQPVYPLILAFAALAGVDLRERFKTSDAERLHAHRLA